MGIAAPLTSSSTCPARSCPAASLNHRTSVPSVKRSPITPCLGFPFTLTHADLGAPRTALSASAIGPAGAAGAVETVGGIAVGGTGVGGTNVGGTDVGGTAVAGSGVAVDGTLVK